MRSHNCQNLPHALMTWQWQREHTKRYHHPGVHVFYHAETPVCMQTVLERRLGLIGLGMSRSSSPFLGNPEISIVLPAPFYETEGPVYSHANDGSEDPKPAQTWENTRHRPEVVVGQLFVFVSADSEFEMLELI